MVVISKLLFLSFLILNNPVSFRTQNISNSNRNSTKFLRQNKAHKIRKAHLKNNFIIFANQLGLKISLLKSRSPKLRPTKRIHNSDKAQFKKLLLIP